MVTAHNKLQLIYRNIESLEEGSDDESVVLDAFFDQFNRGFEGVKEGMNVGQKYLDFATGAEEMGDFDLVLTISQRHVDYFPWDAYHTHKVGAVGPVISEKAVWW